MPAISQPLIKKRLIATFYLALVALSITTSYSMFSHQIAPLFSLNPIEFGIDLTGGSRLSLEVERSAVSDNLKKEITDLLLFYGQFDTKKENDDSITLSGTFTNKKEALKEFQDTYPNLSMHHSTKGVTILGLRSIEHKTIAEAVRGNIDVINTRLNGLGMADVSVFKQSDNKIIVELPSSIDISKAKEILTSTSRINMYLTALDGISLNYKGYPIIRSKAAIAGGKDIISATPIINQQTGLPSISIRLTAEAGRHMGKITNRNIGNPIVTTITNGFGDSINEKVLTVATIQSAFSREFSLTGIGTFEDNEKLALVLRSGVMKAPMNIISEEVIDASMGEINVNQGFSALITAISALFIYIIAKYRVNGVIACLTLLSTASILIILMSVFGASFTMMSIIGVVLTMGMAVDINVIVFEKMKAGGYSLLEAFEKSWLSIIDANITTIIAAQMLFVFGSTQLKGLALVMIFGICSSLISSYWINKNILISINK